ncbi:hypothetical protein FOZ61_005101 [Perkinsus olseni]|uniref:Uncharacterized protein n=1 Tax=Perkinsus olseni TaxID=32597 RepID=A0A7J6LIW7_PEROL|nr:hypothetical protein FOZ61_005101 [Perkinsus olseni]KAF4659266.1 hypothetical protein FOL46_006651 [Perkinsus olseni]
MLCSPSLFALLLAPLAVGDVLDYACEAVCEEVAECATKGTYCKSWHEPKACFGLYWSGGGKMCYQPTDPYCPAEYPVLCEEVAPFAPREGDDATSAASTAPRSTTIFEKMMWVKTTTTTRLQTTTTPRPTEPPSTTNDFYGAMDGAAAAAAMVAGETASSEEPQGRYCGFLGEFIPLSMYFNDETFDMAGVSENDIEGIPYSLSASGCIIPDYQYPPFAEVLSASGGERNPFYVVYDSSKGEIRGTVQGAKIIATPC